MENFEVTIAASNANANTANYSPIARIINGFIRTFNETRTLPKWVVVVPEADIINYIRIRSGDAVEEIFSAVNGYMMSEMRKLVSQITSGLPHKAIKFDWPHFLWIEPVLHTNLQDNNLRIRYIQSLHKVATNSRYRKTVILSMKLGWNNDNIELYHWQRQKFTDKGQKLFWVTLDNAIRFADTKLLKSYGTPFQQVFNKDKLLNDMQEAVKRFRLKHAHRADVHKKLERQELLDAIQQPRDISRQPRRRLVVFNETLDSSRHTDSLRRYDQSNRQDREGAEEQEEDVQDQDSRDSIRRHLF